MDWLDWIGWIGYDHERSPSQLGKITLRQPSPKASYEIGMHIQVLVVSERSWEPLAAPQVRNTTTLWLSDRSKRSACDLIGAGLMETRGSGAVDS